MSESKTQKEFWFEYISKLNDRAIGKTQASGFTTWAICGLVGLIIYKLIDRIPTLIKSAESSFLFLISFANTINLEISFFVLLTSILTKCFFETELRLTPKLSRASRPILMMPIMLLCMFFSLVNFIVAYQVIPASFDKIPYIIFGSFLLLQVAIPVIQKIIKLRKLKTKIAEFPELETDPLSASKYKWVMEAFTTTLALALFYLTWKNWHSFITETSILNNVEFIKVSIEITLLIFLSLYLIKKISSSMHIRFLETLERRIVLEELSHDQIKSIFIQEFLGETTREWISKIQSQFDEYYEICIDSLRKAAKDFSEIQKIDKKYIYEIEGRSEAICKSTKEPYVLFIKTTEESLAKVEHLVSQRAFFFKDQDHCCLTVSQQA